MGHHQMEYTLVSQINPTRHNWTIKVRVARMWKLSLTPKWKGVTAMELVLVDEEVCPLLHADICYFPLTVAVQSETLYIRAWVLPLASGIKTLANLLIL